MTEEDQSGADRLGLAQTRYGRTPRPHSSALDALMLRPIEISRTEGDPASVEGWRKEELSFGAFLDICADPDVIGPALFTPATLRCGVRDPQMVESADILVLDAPAGALLDELVAGLEGLDLQCLVQATNQHQRTTTIVKQCQYEAWLDLPLSAKSLQSALETNLGIETEVLSYGQVWSEGCPAYEVRHLPVTGYRLIFPLERRFRFETDGQVRAGLEQWATAVEVLAQGLVTGWPAYERSPCKPFALPVSQSYAAFTDGRRLGIA